MAIIENIYNNNGGGVLIKDNKRDYPISLCPEGVGYLIQYLNMASHEGGRKILVDSIPRIKSPESRYMMKLAADNSNNAQKIIAELICASSEA